MTKFTTLAEALQTVASAQQQSTFFDTVVFEGTTAQLFADGWELGDKPLPADAYGRTFYTLSKDNITVKVRVQSMNAKSIVVKTNGTVKKIKDSEFEAFTKFSVELV